MMMMMIPYFQGFFFIFVVVFFFILFCFVVCLFFVGGGIIKMFVKHSNAQITNLVMCFYFDLKKFLLLFQSLKMKFNML